MTDQELTLVGLSEDQTSLVLVSGDGQEFQVAADSPLWAALRQARTNPGQVENQMDSALRPRDIQARIRAGESPESVADAADVSVDKVMTYAMPVLAERAHVAQRAQRASVRRSGEGSGGVLSETIVTQLRSRGVDPSGVEWDAWRRDDGRWSLHAVYVTDDRAASAAFTYDAAGRYVVAEDDEARFLIGERLSTVAAASLDAGPRRLSAVGSQSDQPLGEDAIELVSDQQTPATDQDSTADLTDAARALRAVPAQEVPINADHGDADWIVTQASDRPARTAEPQPAAASEELDLALDQPPAEAPRPARKGKGKGRASVPSWDEIMFGSGGRD